MAIDRYSYSTSPRKVEPEIKKKAKKQELKVVNPLPRQEVKVSAEEKKRQFRLTLLVIGVFAVLLVISYRNSVINEKFSEIQDLKNVLSVTQKENEQLSVSIESSMNLNNIEKQAKEQLGMQKATNTQTVYVTLPKKDYIESASEEVIVEENKNWFESLLDNIFN